MGYWHKILSGAWDKTYLPLGWDRKKIALAVVSLCSVLVVGLHFGLAAMTASAIPIFWTVSPVIFAALILFVWGIIETQAKLYAELSTSTSAKVSELEAVVARYKEPPPDYEAWRRVKEMTLHKAAFLWCDMVPRVSVPSKVQAWMHALESAVKTGDLEFSADYRNKVLTSESFLKQKMEAWSETKVTREQLQAYANKQGDQVPIFLRDA